MVCCSRPIKAGRLLHKAQWAIYHMQEETKEKKLQEQIKRQEKKKKAEEEEAAEKAQLIKEILQLRLESMQDSASIRESA